MEAYKKEFIEFLLQTGALKVRGIESQGKVVENDFSLKSQRSSPHFVNIGDFNDGLSTARLGEAYAAAIDDTGAVFDLLYGIPEKGVSLAVATSIGLARSGDNIPWFFTRKMPKEHGESSKLSQAERIKAFVVGRAPKDGNKIVQLDDVFTAGDAKYQARADLQNLGNFEYPLLAIAVDRQEVGIDGTSAIQKYEKDTGTKVVSIVSVSDIFEFFKSMPNVDQKAVGRIANYLRVYGTAAAKKAVGVDSPLDQRIISAEKSIIPACDVESIEKFEELVMNTAPVPGIGGYKVGFGLALAYGLPKVMEVVRKHTDKPVIYDHQKAGTDILDTGKNFAQVCKKSGVDAVILFPQAGPETERAWIYHALDNDLKVIVGGRMTHPGYAVSEGGFISDEGALDMYRIAARAGVTNFVVPGNKPDVIQAVREAVEAEGVKGVFYAPGFVAQGGKIADTTKVAGDSWHAIVGRGIYSASDMKKAAEEHTSQL